MRKAVSTKIALSLTALQGTLRNEIEIENLIPIENIVNRIRKEFFTNAPNLLNRKEEKELFIKVKDVPGIKLSELYNEPLTQVRINNEVEAINSGRVIEIAKGINKLSNVSREEYQGILAQAEQLEKLSNAYKALIEFETSITVAAGVEKILTTEDHSNVTLELRDKQSIEMSTQAANKTFNSQYLNSRLSQFFVGFDRKISFKNLDPEQNLFLREGIEDSSLTSYVLDKVLRGSQPIGNEEDVIYGNNFPRLTDLRETVNLSGISSRKNEDQKTIITEFQDKGLLEQANEAVKILGKLKKQARKAQNPLKEFSKILEVINAVQENNGDLGSYLGSKISEEKIIFRGEELSFDVKSIQNVIRTLEEAIQESKIDEQLKDNFSRIVSKLTNRLLQKFEHLDNFIKYSAYIPDEGEIKPFFYTTKSKNEKEEPVYRIKVDNESLILTNQQELLEESKNLTYESIELKKLVTILEKSPYTENSILAYNDLTITITNPPEYIAETLDKIINLEKQKELEAALQKEDKSSPLAIVTEVIESSQPITSIANAFENLKNNPRVKIKKPFIKEIGDDKYDMTINISISPLKGDNGSTPKLYELVGNLLPFIEEKHPGVEAIIVDHKGKDQISIKNASQALVEKIYDTIVEKKISVA